MNSTAGLGVELSEGQYRLLIPISREITPKEAERRLQIAAAITRERGGGLVVSYLLRFAPQTPLGAIPRENPAVVEAYQATAAFVETGGKLGVPTAGRVHLTHEESQSVLDAVDNDDCDAVLLTVEAGRSQRRRLLGGSTIEKVVARAGCDVFVEKQATGETPIRGILLAVSSGPHSGLAAQTARALAIDTDAHVDVVHFLGQNATADEQKNGEQIIEGAKQVFFDAERVETAIERTEHVAEEIIARSDEYDATVLGSPTSGLLEQFVFGTVPDSVTQRSENAVVMAQRHTRSTSVYDRWIAGDPTQ